MPRTFDNLTLSLSAMNSQLNMPRDARAQVSPMIMWNIRRKKKKQTVRLD